MKIYSPTRSVVGDDKGSALKQFNNSTLSEWVTKWETKWGCFLFFFFFFMNENTEEAQYVPFHQSASLRKRKRKGN